MTNYFNTPPSYFKVLNEVDNNVKFSDLTSTFHYTDERLERHAKIEENIGDGKYLTAFVVDKQHPNGNEIHTIYDNGIILIQNERTKFVITELIARPQQLKRYWTGKKYPDYLTELCQKAHEHQKKDWNNW